jgi:hypothetical protein
MSDTTTRSGHPAASLSVGVAIIAATIAATALIAVVPAVAEAQLGGAIRRAAKQVDKKIGKQAAAAAASPTPDTYGNVILELTPARVDQFVAGLTAGRAVLAGDASTPSRATLSTQRDDLAGRRAAISDKNAKASNDFSERFYAADRCRSNAMRASEDDRRKASDTRVKSDPAVQAKLLAIVQQMQAAVVRNDTAEVARLQRQAQAVGTTGSFRDDTLAADKACGALPARPAFLVQIDSLDAAEKALLDRIRQLDDQAAAAELKASGMTDRQFAMARERVTYFLERAKHDSPQPGFSKAELDALGARKADLEKLL